MTDPWPAALIGTAPFLDELEQLLRSHGHSTTRHPDIASLPELPAPAGAAVLDAAQLHALRAELASARAEFNVFAGRISHDLQSVMQNIEGFAAVLERLLRDRMNEKETHYLDRVRKNAAQGNSMLHDLLGLSRLGVNPVETQPVDLRDAVDRSIRLLAPALKDRDVQWDLSDLPVIHADAALLHQALGHLLGNAVKFTRERSPARISVSARFSQTGAQRSCDITVSDNGAGFDMAGVDRLFHPFERLHDARQYEGNGIGLAMVRRIAERHGGRVAARGETGAGAQFTLTLPQPAQPAQPHGTSPVASQGAAAAAPADTGAASGGRNILLVDDDPLVLMSLTAMLEAEGYRVSAAAGGQAALDELAARQTDGRLPDLVITDLGMPLVDGLQVARAAKTTQPPLPVVLLTGRRPDAGSTDASLPPGVDLVLGKPIRLAQLRSAIQSLFTA